MTIIIIIVNFPDFPLTFTPPLATYWLSTVHTCSVLPRKIIVGHSLGGDCGHIKAYGLALFPHQRELQTEGLLGRHALGMLGRTLCPLQSMAVL